MGSVTAPGSKSADAVVPPLLVRDLGVTDYADVFVQMQTFTADRTSTTADEIWFTEHRPVFTQGQAGKPEHLLLPGDIPVVQTDRGGQVTYHGPGQIVGYLLFDLKRLGIGPRVLVRGIESAICGVLARYDIQAANRDDAPGVYVAGNKIASLGLRIRRGCSYHGLSLNVSMDLEPFQRINPCGLIGMEVTEMCALASGVAIEKVRDELEVALRETFFDGAD